MSQGSQYDVTDLQESTEFVQALEARGDFKFKGIFAIYNTVLEWTNRFPSNRILPSLEQLQKEVSVPGPKFNEFVLELVGKGTSKIRCIYAFPALDFQSGSEAGLIKLTVLCRPTKGDQSSAKKYVDYYKDKTVSAVQKWIDMKDASWDDEAFQFLSTRAEQGYLQDTHTGSEIARYLIMPFDKTADEKKISYARFAKPVIQSLIDQKKLLYLEDSQRNYRTILIPGEDHLLLRMQMLNRFALRAILGGGSSGDDPVETSRTILKKIHDKQLPKGHAQVAAELRLLIPFVEKQKKQKEEQKKKEQVDQGISELQKYKRIVPASMFKNWSSEVESAVRSSKQVLMSEVPRGGKIYEFILHKENIDPAIKEARELFDKKQDDLEIIALDEMKVDRFLDGDRLKAYEDLMQRSMFHQLPWFKRLLRSLFGAGKLRPDEAISIKTKVKSEMEQEKLKIRKSEARKKQKQLAQERMEETDPQLEAAKKEKEEQQKNPVEIRGISQEEMTEEAKETLEAQKKADEELKAIIQFIDSRWKSGDIKELPTRSDVLKQFPHYDEDGLIQFLKKYGRKEIMSFRVPNDDPKFVWPILISKRYVKQNGRKLLKDSMALADEQRNAAMPNQYKFDVYTAIEDFLNRIINRQT